jgi:Choline/Carnitine o-acyltransferase
MSRYCKQHITSLDRCVHWHTLVLSTAVCCCCFVQAAIAAKEEFAVASDNCGLAVVDFQEFGKNAFKQWKISPDAAAQMAFQTAYYSLHGHLPTVSANKVYITMLHMSVCVCAVVVCHM